MGTAARMKTDKEIQEDGKKRGMRMERSKAGTKKAVPTAYHSVPYHKHTMVLFYIWKEYNEINKKTK